MTREAGAQAPFEGPNITYVTSADVARLFSVAKSTVRLWVSQGILNPAFTTPGGHHRFLASDVESLRAARSARGGGESE